ncbi:MAG: HDOD domain-containing protein [Deltaproteobacteria bacterium]|nr:HDOD domain-containing protein [Deltaproteobacteria bacterium]
MKKITMQEIDHLIDELGEISTLPSIATTIMEKTLKDNVNAKQIAEMVEMDQALAAKVLKIANSPFYRRIKEISTIRGAVVLLGLNVLKSIVLSISVVNLFNEKNKNALDLFKFWQHSIACAVCAKAIAQKIFPASAEDAFVVGLLHDLGKVVADQTLCKNGEYREVLEAMDRGNMDILELEQHIVGIDHAELGKHLMEKWNIPSILCESVSQHHAIPSGSVKTSEVVRLSAIVHVADMISNHLGLGIVQTQTGFIEPSLLGQLELSSQDIQDISISLKDSIHSLSENMGIPKAEPKTYFEVLQFANAQLGKLSLDLDQKKMALERRAIELSSLNQMSSQLQSCLKLPEITNILSTYCLTILEAQKVRCMIRLNQMRIMLTESFWVNNSAQTRTGVTGATKELLDNTNGIYPKSTNILFTPIKVNDKIIGVVETIPAENQSREDITQKNLLLRSIAEAGAQAIQRAMLITKNIKAQRLTAVSKTAIAANHEINSPLTTILLKLDMVLREESLNPGILSSLKEIKAEAIKIKHMVKKMLDISDIVETRYTNEETMLDIHKATDKTKEISQDNSTMEPETETEEIPGFEEFLPLNVEESSKQTPTTTDNGLDELSPGFESYLDE